MTLEEFKEKYPEYFNGTDGQVYRIEYQENASHQVTKEVADRFVRSLSYPNANISPIGLQPITPPSLARYQLEWAILGMAYQVRNFPNKVENIDPRDWSPEAHDFFKLFHEPFAAFTFNDQKDPRSGYADLGYATFEYLLCVVDKDHIGIIVVGDED